MTRRASLVAPLAGCLALGLVAGCDGCGRSPPPPVPPPAGSASPATPVGSAPAERADASPSEGAGAEPAPAPESPELRRARALALDGLSVTRVLPRDTHTELERPAVEHLVVTRPRFGTGRLARSPEAGASAGADGLPVDLLYVHLAGPGRAPSESALVLASAARAGLRAIGLTYPDVRGVADVCAPELDPAAGCWERARRALAGGEAVSGEVVLSPTQSLEGRLAWLLESLARSEPMAGWERYLERRAPEEPEAEAAGADAGAGGDVGAGAGEDDEAGEPGADDGARARTPRAPEAAARAGTPREPDAAPPPGGGGGRGVRDDGDGEGDGTGQGAGAGGGGGDGSGGGGGRGGAPARGPGSGRGAGLLGGRGDGSGGAPVDDGRAPRVRWSHVVLGGVAGAAGDAALLARRHEVARVVLFAGPVDGAGERPAPWLEGPGLTPADRWRALVHSEDPGLSRILSALRTLRVLRDDERPAPAEAVEAPGASRGGARVFVTSRPARAGGGGAALGTAADAATPLDAESRPALEPLWRRLLAGG